MTDVPPLDPAVRQAIRHRGRQLRRRRHAVAAGSAGLIVLAAVVPAVVLSHSSKPKPVQVATSADCPAADVPVHVRVGAKASLARIPQGWSLNSGSPDQPENGLTYASPAEEAKAQQMDRNTSYSPPSVSLAVTFPSTALPAPSSATPTPLHPPPANGAKTTTATINGFAAKVVTTYNGPSGQPPSPAYPQTESISWSPAPDTSVNVTGTNIPAAELLDIARSATYQAGTVVQLPSSPTFTVTAAKAEKALLSAARATHAALSSWAEVKAVAGMKDQAAPDYRPVWLVYSPAGTGRVTWAVVDARSGQVLHPPTTANAGWVHMVTDRSQPGCQPPLGIPTRSETAQIEFSGPAPAGYKLLLTTGPEAQTILGGSGGPCDLACAPLVWIAYRLGAQIDVKLINALTMRPIGEISGPGPLQTPLPEDLDPGPTPTGPAGLGPTTPPTVARITTNTAPISVPIVGPSPFYPGTTNPKAAPAGNGKGPAGSCNGTETYPPCGPGVVEHEYYPYTLPSNCTGYLYFDGRWWQQELYEPNQPTQNVWMIYNGGGAAGWVGPGAVGISPAPPGPPPACGTTPASVPSLPGSG